MYENKTERYPVALFLLFQSKRPVELQNTSCFYLTVTDAPLTDVWYKIQAMEVNTINTMFSRMKKTSALAELCSNKKNQTTLQEKQPFEN